MRQHGEHLTQITRYGSFNSYLVRESDGLTAIDTNLPGSAPALLAAARQLGQPITRIVLTHAHGDHVGSLDALRAALPNAEVSISARDARLLSGDRSLDPNEPQHAPKGDFRRVTTTPDRLLTPGDRIGSLVVIAAPGHTPGHAAFLDTRDASLIAGDAFQTAAGTAVAGVPSLLFPFPALATWHPATALQSAQHLLALNPTRLAVGHGPVLEDPRAAMTRAIDTATRRLARRSA